MYFCGGGDDTAGPAPALEAAGGGVDALGAAEAPTLLRYEFIPDPVASLGAGGVYFCGGGEETAGPAPALEDEAAAAGGGVEATGAAAFGAEAAEEPTLER